MTVKPFWSEIGTQSIKECFARVNQQEFDRIQTALTYPGSPWSFLESQRPINGKRNRYTNVFPWDKNRVKLPIHGEGALDYINASYVRLDANLKYIATQGPTNSTVHHFWAMCFNEAEAKKEDNVIVVMVTPLVESNIVKCAQYWPNKKNTVLDLTDNIKADNIKLDGLTVSYEEEIAFDDYTLTKLRLYTSTKEKVVYHFYYHEWSDSRVPLRPHTLIDLLEDILKLKKDCKVSTPIIHCSAGVGRTGTFIAMDYFNHNPSHLLKSQSRDPIHELFQHMRDSRIMMIQTDHQYLFLYYFFKEQLDL